jgi:5-formyltetrahydrofolate cyclo-ligase
MVPSHKALSIDETKRALRREARARLKALPPAQRTEGSARARQLLAVQPLWQQAESILFYAPMPEELDLWPLLIQTLASGRVAALPCFVKEANRYIACRVRNLKLDLKKGQLGIREPADHCTGSVLNRLDLILVPGVAFDLHGRRLGRGKGFYDQLLADLRGVTCGVAFDEQLVDEVPVAPHDVSLNRILTPTRWVEPRSARGLE